MPKTIRNQFYKKLTFEKLIQAHYRARKHKAYKNEVIKFEFNLENNLVNIQNRLKIKHIAYEITFPLKCMNLRKEPYKPYPIKIELCINGM